MSTASQTQYQRFTVVCFADEVTSAAIEEVRRLVPPRVAVMPAHVTAKGSFTEPVSLETVQARIRAAAQAAAPMRVRVSDVALTASHLGLRIECSPELAALHDRLYSALEDLVTDVYGDKPGSGYQPHLTVFYGLTAEDRDRALQVVPRLRCIAAVGLTAVSLVGRVGGSQDGRWEVVCSLPLGT